jgi:hypothetical protein
MAKREKAPDKECPHCGRIYDEHHFLTHLRRCPKEPEILARFTAKVHALSQDGVAPTTKEYNRCRDKAALPSSGAIIDCWGGWCNAMLAQGLIPRQKRPYSKGDWRKETPGYTREEPWENWTLVGCGQRVETVPQRVELYGETVRVTVKQRTYTMLR